jgi:hypothetical protein
MVGAMSIIGQMAQPGRPDEAVPMPSAGKKTPDWLDDGLTMLRKQDDRQRRASLSPGK